MSNSEKEKDKEKVNVNTSNVKTESTPPIKSEDGSDKVTAVEFCETAGIRASAKIVAGKLYGDRKETMDKWKKVLKKDEVVDFDNPNYFVDKDGMRAYLNQQKFKEEKQ